MRAAIRAALLGAPILSRALQAQTTAWPTATSVTVPSVESTTAPVEPCVIDTVTGWNGKRYWMTYNNYPVSNNDQLENPAIVCSDDGDTWATPAGGSNPVVPALTGGTAFQYYNSDPHIFLLSGTMYLFWRVLDVRAGHGTYAEEYFYVSSTDGVTWSAKTTTGLRLAYVDASTKARMLDACFAYDGTQWIAWLVNADALSTGQIEQWTGSLGGSWNKTVCTVPVPANISGTSEKWWHLDVKAVAGGYAALFQTDLGATAAPGNVYYAYTRDGLTWTVDTKRPVCDQGTGFPSYRATLSRLSTDTGWDVWVTNYATRTLKRMQLTDGYSVAGGSAAETAVATVETRVGSSIDNTPFSGVSFGARDAVKAFIQTLNDNSKLSLIDVLNIRPLPAQAHALCDFKNAFDDTIVGSLTFTAGQGFTGGTTSNYLSSSYNPTSNGVNYLRNDASMVFLDRLGTTAGTGGNSIIIGLGASGTTVASQLGKNTSDNIAGQLNYGVATGREAGTVSSVGPCLFSIKRTGSTAQALFVNNAAAGTAATASTGVPNAIKVSHTDVRSAVFEIIGAASLANDTIVMNAGAALKRALGV